MILWRFFSTSQVVQEHQFLGLFHFQMGLFMACKMEVILTTQLHSNMVILQDPPPCNQRQNKHPENGWVGTRWFVSFLGWLKRPPFSGASGGHAQIWQWKTWEKSGNPCWDIHLTFSPMWIWKSNLDISHSAGSWIFPDRSDVCFKGKRSQWRGGELRIKWQWRVSNDKLTCLFLKHS